jgi:hypothetical protein
MMTRICSWVRVADNDGLAPYRYKIHGGYRLLQSLNGRGSLLSALIAAGQNQTSGTPEGRPGLEGGPSLLQGQRRVAPISDLEPNPG